MGKKKSIWEFSSEEEVRKEVRRLWEKIQKDPNWRKLYEILAEL